MFKKNGFSLMELMIVVSIISILTMLAIPNYLDYVKRARFAEVVSATDPFKTAVALALQSGAEMQDLGTGNNGIPQAPNPTKNLLRLVVESGIITAVSTKIAGDADLILTPNNDGTLWTVSGSCLAAGLCIT